MGAIEILVQEHRLIESVLECLTRATEALRTKGELDVATFQEAVTFFREFADKTHHQKEEACLFPVLEERGILRDGGPIGVILDEHDRGRTLVSELESEIVPAAAGDRDAQRRLESNALEFVQLLTEHIQKEDQILFDLANRILSPEDHDRIEKGYDAPVHSTDFHELACGICARWDVTPPTRH